ncbi:MAG: hypothetical protein HC888_01635 [Candidatus Competibacteraceae bacterium]|nr:hypothetical protein [Candidatus Competibacteraceae bacterium]
MSTIAELFARDPLKHTQKDLEDIVAYFRSTRKDFREAGVRAKSTKTLNTKEQEAKATGLDFDL